MKLMRIEEDEEMMIVSWDEVMCEDIFVLEGWTYRSLTYAYCCRHSFGYIGEEFSDRGYLIVHDNSSLEVGFTFTQAFANGSLIQLCAVSSSATFAILNDTNTPANTTVVSITEGFGCSTSLLLLIP